MQQHNQYNIIQIYACTKEEEEEKKKRKGKERTLIGKFIHTFTLEALC